MWGTRNECFYFTWLKVSIDGINVTKMKLACINKNNRSLKNWENQMTTWVYLRKSSHNSLQLACRAKQMTRFYMKCNTGLKWVKCCWGSLFQGSFNCLDKNLPCKTKSQLMHQKQNLRIHLRIPYFTRTLVSLETIYLLYFSLMLSGVIKGN